MICFTLVNIQTNVHTHRQLLTSLYEKLIAKKVQFEISVVPVAQKGNI